MQAAGQGTHRHRSEWVEVLQGFGLGNGQVELGGASDEVGPDASDQRIGELDNLSGGLGDRLGWLGEGLGGHGRQRNRAGAYPNY